MLSLQTSHPTQLMNQLPNVLGQLFTQQQQQERVKGLQYFLLGLQLGKLDPPPTPSTAPSSAPPSVSAPAPVSPPQELRFFFEALDESLHPKLTVFVANLDFKTLLLNRHKSYPQQLVQRLSQVVEQSSDAQEALGALLAALETLEKSQPQLTPKAPPPPVSAPPASLPQALQPPLPSERELRLKTLRRIFKQWLAHILEGELEKLAGDRDAFEALKYLFDTTSVMVLQERHLRRIVPLAFPQMRLQREVLLRELLALRQGIESKGLVLIPQPGASLVPFIMPSVTGAYPAAATPLQIRIAERSKDGNFAEVRCCSPPCAHFALLSPGAKASTEWH